MDISNSKMALEALEFDNDSSHIERILPLDKREGSHIEIRQRALGTTPSMQWLSLVYFGVWVICFAKNKLKYTHFTVRNS